MKKSALRWFEWGGFTALLWIVVTLIGIFLPVRYDDGVIAFLDIMEGVIVFMFGVSVFSYYRFTLTKEVWHGYRITWEYIPKNGGASILEGKVSYLSPVALTTDRELLVGCKLHEDLQEYKKYLDNGTIEITNVTYTGEKIQNNG